MTGPELVAGVLVALLVVYLAIGCVVAIVGLVRYGLDDAPLLTVLTLVLVVVFWPSTIERK